jgi:hypothetical protein
MITINSLIANGYLIQTDRKVLTAIKPFKVCGELVHHAGLTTAGDSTTAIFYTDKGMIMSGVNKLCADITHKITFV